MAGHQTCCSSLPLGIPRIARICGHQVGLACNMDKPQHSRPSLDTNGISNLSLLSSHGASVYAFRPPFPIILSWHHANANRLQTDSVCIRAFVAWEDSRSGRGTNPVWIVSLFPFQLPTSFARVCIYLSILIINFLFYFNISGLFGATIFDLDTYRFSFGLVFNTVADEMCSYSVNTVVPADQVLSTAIDLAKEITRNSPDAVQSTKVALLLAQKYGVEEAFRTHVWSPEARRVYEGDNIKVCLLFGLPSLECYFLGSRSPTILCDTCH